MTRNTINRRKFINSIAAGSVGMYGVTNFEIFDNELNQKITKVGIIGLDTS